MNRRQFLAGATGWGGYTVVVRAADPASPATTSPPVEQPAPESAVPGHETAGATGGDPHLVPVDLETDVLVAGGGMAGVCAALAAARHGARVLLVQDRAQLGGNASSEIRMHIVGADCHGARPGWREGGLIEELRLDDAVRNPQRSFSLWDLLLYDKVLRESNITLLLDTTLCGAEVRQGRIERAIARCDRTEHRYRITASQYLDCTGDSRLALEAGAEFRMGREGRDEFGESLAGASADAQTQGSSLLFTARDHGRPMPFQAPPWARTIRPELLEFRRISSWEYGYWWIEWGGQLNSIRDDGRIRHELLAIVLGVWNHIKNSGAYPSSATWALEWIGFLPGKRESRRILGDYVLTQQDLEGRRGEPPDAIAIGGWPMDDHPPSGFDASSQPPFRSIKLEAPYGIPLRSLYSRSLSNLFMAGRNISASHVAFSSSRVMATCACLGQAAGTAAACCVRHRLTPRQLATDPARVRELQQLLLRDDQTLKGLRNEDPLDLARQARATASGSHEASSPQNVIDGWVRDPDNGWKHRWGVRLESAPVWIQLEWEAALVLRRVQITFDTGFHRELTLSAADAVGRRVIRAPQPETVRDYDLQADPGTGTWQTLAAVRGNHQRLNRHSFNPTPVQKLRLLIHATHGDPIARVYEIRAYA
ncbi:MAG TPA: FAD-dependent oxidoreductase [Verrucomicrobiota bacterium]|nr:FAD-dependent oxidoreductase [Verrucomicrobiota bacterium]HNU52314.1 FAD-dependent oxidoreductase [Verrucomicrobiota bacterium]